MGRSRGAESDLAASAASRRVSDDRARENHSQKDVSRRSAHVSVSSRLCFVSMNVYASIDTSFMVGKVSHTQKSIY